MLSCGAWLSGGLGFSNLWILRTGKRRRAQCTLMHRGATPEVINAFRQRRPDTSAAIREEKLHGSLGFTCARASLIFFLSSSWESRPYFYIYETFLSLSLSREDEETVYMCMCVYDLIPRRSYVTLENCSLKIVQSNKRAMEKLCRQFSEKRTVSYVWHRRRRNEAGRKGGALIEQRADSWWPLIRTQKLTY